MIDIKIELIGDQAIVAKFEQLPEHVRACVLDKLKWLTDILYKSVIENLSGKILEPKTGGLRASIEQHVTEDGDVMSGWVGPVPADIKAWVQEYGGKSEYEIVPTKARLLHFFAKGGDEVFTSIVHHPPLQERAYLRKALEDMPYLVYQGFLDALDTAIAL